MSPSKPNSQKSGFTLFEALVAITVGSVLLSLTLSIYMLASRQYRTAHTGFQRVQSARVALDRMAFDLERTPFVADNISRYADSPSAAIELADPDSQSLRFVRYYLAGTDLYRQVRSYAFAIAPGVPVPPNTEDNYNNAPESTIVSNNLIAEHVAALKLYGTNPITIELTITQNNESYQSRRSVVLRNAY